MRSVVLMVMLISAGPACAIDSDQELSQGVQAYREGHYSEAANHFAAAVRMDPGFLTARLYLATAYLSQYIPGLNAPENLHFAELAQRQFQEVLSLDPENDVAIASIASMYFTQKKYDEAKQWYYDLTEVDPENQEAFYTLGVIAWTEFHTVDPGPNADARVRGELRQQWDSVLAEGMHNLESALSLDKDYDAAMGYMSLLLRQRANLAESPEQSARDTQAADEWAAKAAAVRKHKAH